MAHLNARALAERLNLSSGGAAYRGLAESLRLLIMDGRVSLDTTLPGERELAETIGVSRTTITAAYRLLRDEGYLTARQGRRPVTSVPESRVHRDDMFLEGPSNLLDLAHATMEAPAELHTAYTQALADLPRHLPGHGYHARGVPQLRAVIAEDYTRRGLPTVAEEVMITTGVQPALALIAQWLHRSGIRALVENPTYPHAQDCLARVGCRLVRLPVSEDGWDLATLDAVLSSTHPALAYLVVDFHTPTGRLMDSPTRTKVARALRRASVVPVIDETLRGLALDTDVPEPFGAHHAGAITIGSASKSFWGGLRVAWIRAERDIVDRLVVRRAAVDLGTPVMEQLAVAHLIHDHGCIAPGRRDVLRARRATLLAEAGRLLPDWRLVTGPGGQAAWATLPRPMSSALAVAGHEFGYLLAAGPRFGAGGTFESHVRIPYTLPEPSLREALRRVAAAADSLPARLRRTVDRETALA